MTTADNKLKRPLSIRALLEILVLLVTAGYAIYSMHSLNQANIENTKKVEQLIVSLNERVDQFIASDDKVYNRYIKNLRKSLDSLNEDERKLVMSVYDVRQKTGE